MAEHSSKRTARVLEAQSLVLPGALSSSAPDDDAAADATYTVNEAIDHMGERSAVVSGPVAAGAWPKPADMACMQPAHISRWHVQSTVQRLRLAGFGWFQLLLLLYTGLAWAADAMEMMLLSFLGPAVRCDWGLSATQVPGATTPVWQHRIMCSPSHQLSLRCCATVLCNAAAGVSDHQCGFSRHDAGRQRLGCTLRCTRPTRGISGT